MFTATVMRIDRMSGLGFEAFFQAEYERLLRTMFVQCRSRSEAEDLAQETMARVFERWDSVRHADSPTAYAYGIAFNLHRSAVRRARLALRHRRADRDTPDDPGAIAERRDELLRALRSLPPSQREALLLVELVGMTSEEAARVLGIEPASVRGRIHRARTTLRAKLGGMIDG